MAKYHFNVGAFYGALDSERHSRNLTWKQVAAEAGVSASTLTRMAQGKRPDADGLASLLGWGGLNMDTFIAGGATTHAAPDALTQISAYLRADPNLTPESADALDRLLRVSYEQLKRK